MLPGPTNVPNEVMRALNKPIVNHRGETFKRLYRSVIEKAKKVFKTEQEVMILTCSGTGGVEASIVNLIKKGDKVIVPSFGEFSSRLAKQISDFGGEVLEIKAPLGSAPSYEELEEAFERNSNVKALYLVTNETSTGVRIPWVKKAGSLCSKYDSFFIADAVSNLGGDELPVDDYNIDICITASQKCLAAPPGLALLSISKRARKYMEENPTSSLFFNLPRYFKFFYERGEPPFTPSIPLFYALDVALDLVIEEGLDKRIRRHKVCAEAFYEALEAMDFKAFPKRELRSQTVLAFWHREGINDSQFREYLDQKYGVIIAGGFGEVRGKVFRIGSMGIINSHHVIRTLSSMIQALRDLGFSMEEKAISLAEAKLKELR